MDTPVPPVEQMAPAIAAANLKPPGRFALTPIGRRRWRNFRANGRGFWSLWLFALLFFVSLFAEIVANDKPFLVHVDGHTYFPVFATYPETAFGGDFETEADYRDPYLVKLIADRGGFMLWPPIRYSYDTINRNLPTPAPSPPTWRPMSPVRA